MGQRLKDMSQLGTKEILFQRQKVRSLKGFNSPQQSKKDWYDWLPSLFS